MVTIWFDAQFKKKAGVRLEPTEGELEKYGFSSDEPEIEEEEPEEEEEIVEPARFKVLIKIPSQGFPVR